MESDARNLKKQWLAEQMASARTAFPLSTEQLKCLFQDVRQEIDNVGCDHTRRLTDKWLSDRRIPPAKVFAWLDENGGYCDCEVVANAGDHFDTNRE